MTERLPINGRAGSLKKKTRGISKAKPAPLPKLNCSPAVPRFLQILLAERDRLKGLARFWTGDSDAAEDLVQETIIRAWRAREQFSGEGLHPWLKTIMRNKHWSDIRKLKNSRHFDALIAPESFAVPCLGAATIDAEILAERVASLPPGQRDAMGYIANGDSYQDTAERLGVNIGTVKSRVARAREALES